jgi:hypothetical protein
MDSLLVYHIVIAIFVSSSFEDPICMLIFLFICTNIMDGLEVTSQTIDMVRQVRGIGCMDLPGLLLIIFLYFLEPAIALMLMYDRQKDAYCYHDLGI